MIVLQNVAFLADSTAAAVPVALPVAETEVSLSFFDMAIKGGVIMIPIVLLLLLAVYIFIERVVVIRNQQ